MKIPGHFSATINTVEAFFNSLVDAGYLISGSPNSYYVSESHIDRLCKRERLREAYERRRNDLLGRLGVVIIRKAARSMWLAEAFMWMRLNQPVRAR